MSTLLRTGSIGDLRAGRLSRADGYLVIAMRRYPRGIARARVDEYLRVLSPATELLDEFLATREACGDHDHAYDAVDYARRFELAIEAMSALARLAALARTRDVYLLCQCDRAVRCHRDMLLLAARAWFDAPIEEPPHDYRAFAARLTSST